MATKKTNLYTLYNNKRKTKKTYIVLSMLILFSLCIALFTLYNAFSQDNLYATSYEKKIKEAVAIHNKTRRNEEISKILNELTLEIHTIETDITTVQKDIKEAASLQKNLSSLSSDIEKAQEIMFKTQEHALNIGKFTCKVNTCQSDPSHANYPAFLKATDDLVTAKQNLQKAKDTYQKAKNITSYMKNNQTKLKQLKVKRTKLIEEKQTIEKTYLT